MSRLNMVRKIKDWKKDQTKVKDIYEIKREKDWDERFIYNKLENNQEIKRTIPKKNNVKTIQIKEVKDKEKRYLNQDEIQLTGKIPGNKKEKKIRIDRFEIKR